jgi:hypothetical protein
MPKSQIKKKTCGIYVYQVPWKLKLKKFIHTFYKEKYLLCPKRRLSWSFFQHPQWRWRQRTIQMDFSCWYKGMVLQSQRRSLVKILISNRENNMINILALIQRFHHQTFLDSLIKESRKVYNKIVIENFITAVQ